MITTVCHHLHLIITCDRCNSRVKGCYPNIKKIPQPGLSIVNPVQQPIKLYNYNINSLNFLLGVPICNQIKIMHFWWIDRLWRLTLRQNNCTALSHNATETASSFCGCLISLEQKARNAFNPSRLHLFRLHKASATQSTCKSGPIPPPW